MDSPWLTDFLALRVGVQLRDQAGVRQCLRHVATHHEPVEGERMVKLLADSLDGGGKFWLRDLLGPRNG